MARYRATVFYTPQSETDLVILKPSWGADNGYETAVFPTQAEAIDFAWRRWRVPREEIRITGPAPQETPHPPNRQPPNREAR